MVQRAKGEEESAVSVEFRVPGVRGLGEFSAPRPNGIVEGRRRKTSGHTLFFSAFCASRTCSAKALAHVAAEADAKIAHPPPPPRVASILVSTEALATETAQRFHE